jgi:hypothetical protein
LEAEARLTAAIHGVEAELDHVGRGDELGVWVVEHEGRLEISAIEPIE